MTPSATVSEAARRFAPTLVTELAVLRNGAAAQDLQRLADELDAFGDDLIAAAEASGEDLPLPLVDSLVTAITCVVTAT